MKLISITEGFQYRTEMTPEQIAGADYKMIRKGGKIVFFDIDTPNDFIYVQPVMASKELPIKPPDRNALTTFEGAKIWYGFTVVDPASYRSGSVSSQFPRREAEKLVNNILDYGWPPNSRRVKIETLQVLKKLYNDWAIELKRPNPIGGDPEADQENLEKIKSLIAEIEKAGRNSISGYLQEIGKQDTTGTTAARSHLNQLQIVFAKVVKDPQDDDEMEVAVRFANMAIQLFNNVGPDGYDVVFYPQSTKGFNKDMATAIAENKGGAMVVQIDKRKVKDVTFNDEEAIIRAKRDQKRGHGGLSDIANIPAAHENWPRAWATNEISKLRSRLGSNPERTAEIKGFEYGDKRRYAHLFAGVDPTLFEGTKALIVDDNVQHQGTLEMLHAIVKIAGVSSIDLYSPLWLKTGNF